MTLAGALAAVPGLAAIRAAGTRLRAAWLWYRASLVPPDPGWGPDLSEPVDPYMQQMGWIAALITASSTSAALNASAARWTAVAVILAGPQSAAGFLASAFG